MLREGQPLVTCPACYGHPQAVDDLSDETCGWCSGLGMVTESRRLEWLVP